jgi:cytochrome c
VHARGVAARSEESIEEIDMRHLVIAAALLAASTGTSFAQDAEAGATVFKQCSVCHKIGPGATKFVGPELNGLDGRKAGSTDYNYSDGMKESGIVWDAKTFAEYIRAPKAKVPDTKMTYAGINGDGADKKIANLWAYLSQYKADGSKK